MRLDLPKVKKMGKLLLKKWFRKLFKTIKRKKRFNFLKILRLNKRRFSLRHIRRLRRKPISRSINKK